MLKHIKIVSMVLAILLWVSGGISFAKNEKDNPNKSGNQGNNGKWKLVWSDEFDGKGKNLNPNGVDLSKWGYQEGTGSQYGLTDWGNNERQYYLKENARVEDGKLIIEAKKETHGNKQYTSSRLYTGETFAKKYGRFEARIKLPEGEGFWPAFWMMPKDDVYGGWAASGEIDIMEAKGRLPNEASGAIHYGGQWPNNTYAGGTYKFPEGQKISDFHEYALEWEPGVIRWYIDGNLYKTIDNWHSQGQNQGAKYSFPAPFDQEFFIIMNLAVGGNFDGGRMPSDDMFPARMEVDYVRVYESNKPYKDVEEPIVEKEGFPGDAKLPLGDGNWVYDNQFRQPINIINGDGVDFDPLYWNFLTLPEFGGGGSISIEEIDGTNFARANITSGGNQNYSVQLIQNVTVGKGRTYKVSFDAKSTGTRNINVKISAGVERAWVTYSRDESIALTDRIQSYEFFFDMAHDTDPKARLEFNMGLNNSPVWIGNVRMEEVESLFDEDGPKKPLPNGNHIYNGTFDQGYIHRMTFWSLVTDEGKAKVNVDERTRELFVKMQKAGKKPDAIKIVQKGLNLLKGSDYEVTFKARADKPRPIYVDVTNKNGDLSYSGRQRIDVTTSMNEHTVRFTMEEDNNPEGLFNFLLGNDNSDVYIDDVAMIRTGGLPEKKWKEIGENLIVNGKFEDNLDDWKIHNQGEYEEWAGLADFDVEDGKVKATVKQVGWRWWHIQLYQEPVQVSAGTYKISFDMWSEKERKVYAELTDSGTPIQTFTVTPDMNTYEAIIEVARDGRYKFMFGLGRDDDAGDPVIEGEYNIYIDNVKLIEVEED